MKVSFTCTYPNCGKTYVNGSILKRHVQAFHLNTKKFQCSVCGKCLASQQNLKEHKYTHTGERPYICDFAGCSSAFRQGTHLSAHKKFEHIDVIEGNTPEKYFFSHFSTSKSVKTQAKCEQVTQNHQPELLLPLISGPQIFQIPNIFKN